MPAFALALIVAAGPPPATPAEFAEWAKSEAVLGTTPDYLERRLGPARQKSANFMLFDVDGCSVIYEIENGAVSSLSTELSPSCHAQTQGHRISAHMTFGQVKTIVRGGYYEADCLAMCGNAWTPEYRLITGGSHADDYVHVVYGSTAWPAQEAWSSAIWNRLIGDGVREPYRTSAFVCPQDPPPRVAALVDQSLIQRVWIGRGLTGRCAPSAP